MAAPFKMKGTATAVPVPPDEQAQNASQVPPPPDEQPSGSGVSWEAPKTGFAYRGLNQPIADPNDFSQAFFGRGNTPDVLRSKAAPGNQEPGHPWKAAFNTFRYGAAADASDLVDSMFTSPVGIAMTAAGPLAKGAEAVNAATKVGRVAKIAGATANTLHAAQIGAGVGFGAKGAGDVYDAGTENTPEAWEKRLSGASMIAGGAAGAGEGVKSLGRNVVRGSLANRTVPDTGGLTTGQVYRTMRDSGVPMTTGQGGRGRIAPYAETFAEHTPGGAGRMEDFKSKQALALSDAVRNLQDSFDPANKGKDIAETGGQLQSALKTGKDVAHQNASDAYKNVDLSGTILDTNDIVSQAQALKTRLTTGEIKSLQPQRAISILDEISKAYGEQHNMLTLADALHQDRSRLMNSQFTDDPTYGESEGAMRQLGGSITQKLESVPGLKDANSLWADYKTTYGDKGSPVVRAIGEGDPTKVVDAFLRSPGKGTGNLEAVRMLKRVAPDFVGVIKREMVRRLYDPNGSGVTEGYGGMQNRLNKYNEAIMKELFTPEELNQVRAFSAGSKAITRDVNPSGTAHTQITRNVMEHPISSLVGGRRMAASVASRFTTSEGMNDLLFDYDPQKGQSSIASRPQTQTQAAPQSRTMPNPFRTTQAQRAYRSQAGAIGEDIIGKRTAKVRTPGEPLEHGFDMRSAEDFGNAAREAVEKEQGSLPRGERRKIERTPEEQQTQALFGQARRELGDDASSDEVMDRVDELKAQGGSAVKQSPKGKDFFGAGQPTEQSKTGLSSITDKYIGEGEVDPSSLASPKAAKKIEAALADTNKVASQIVKAHESGNGGSTYNLAKGNLKGQDAFAVSVFPEMSQTVTGKLTADHVEKFISAAPVQELLKNPNVSVGTWDKNGNVVLDLVATPSNLDAARKLGRRYNQEAIHDLQNGRDIKTGGAMPDRDIFNLANEYNKTRGLGGVTHREYSDTDSRAPQIAEAYDKMQHNPTDPKVAASYKALGDEVEAQYQFAKSKGIKFEPWKKEGQPYKNSNEMMKDVQDNKHLYFFQGGDIPEDHPLAARDADGLSLNDKLRAVHDLFGHAKDSNQFGPRGEENAWAAHSQMFSKEALPALTSETKGQNSWVNFGPNKDLPPAQRPFGKQKAGLLPEEFYSRESSPFSDRLKDIKEPGSVDAVHYSNAADLDQLQPGKFNRKGWSSENKRNPQDMTFLGKRGQYTEKAVQGRANRYGADLNASRYYDLDKDPQGLWKEAEKDGGTEGDIFNRLDAKVRELGYSGHIDPSGVIRSFDPVNVSKEDIPDWADRLLKPEERATIKNKTSTKNFVKTLSSLPKVQEWIDTAKAGEVGRAWYSRSVKAFDELALNAPDYFKDGDREKFTDFMAALSPKQSTWGNLREALHTWKQWVDADRPEGNDAEKLLRDNLTMATGKIPNALKALKGDDLWPTIEKSRYFKVPSFSKNLRGMFDHVTADSWMGAFSGVGEREITNASSYHPLAVMTRAAAKSLGWEPAEAQAAIWVFTRTLAEKSGWKGIEERKDIRGEINGITPNTMKAYADDFADIMANDSETRQLMQGMGVNLEQLDKKLAEIGHPPLSAGASHASANSLGKLADRLERKRGELAGTTPKQREVQDDTSFEPDELGDRPKYRAKKRP